MQDMSYGPVAVMLVVVLLGALLLGVAMHIRGGAERASPTLGVLYALVIAAPVVAGIVYYSQGLTRDLAQRSPHLYPSAGSPPAVQAGEVPLR